MAKMLRVVAKRDGFRRCGERHSAEGRDFPLDRFTKEERARLEADPMLVVHEGDVADAKKAEPPKDPAPGKGAPDKGGAGGKGAKS